MSVYLEASALWTMYYGERGGENVEWVLETYPSITLEWSLLELGRAISKRLNIGEITEEEAESLEEFILLDIKKLKKDGKLKLVKLTWRLIEDAYALIRPLNIYASDATHLTASLIKGVRIMLADDHHFERLKDKVKKPEIVPITLTREKLAEKIAKHRFFIT